MTLLYLSMIVFLFVLAAFDLWVGVSNDAVNFLTSAIGSKVAKFRTILIIAAIGVFCGATMSDGMMEIARHGIMQPQHFYFAEVMVIFMAVTVTDIVLLDLFNTYGMPTSTTVSMVFELMGATFCVALVKIATTANALSFGDYLNTEKALTIIFSIFLSVAIAFVFGILIQWVSRLIFSFNLRSDGLRWKMGIFGGIALTAIVWFMLIKGLSHLSFMEGAPQEFVDSHTGTILLGCLVFFTLLMQLLHFLHVNVFKIVVLFGTFALATAFAGNDLVNFIGVSLAGYSSFMTFVSTPGADPWSLRMDSLNGPADTPIVFLLAAGTIMVVALALSKKARKVTQTTIDLSRQQEGDEMFGSSRAARSLVRWSMSVSEKVADYVPAGVTRFVEQRFKPVSETAGATAADTPSFDLVRASVNLVVAALLIALGTSLKLPLSTTYVTFMVAMGSSLADRAWGRESAVFRITGVLTVIGGWFLTAVIAFGSCFFVALMMYYGGFAATAVIVAIALGVLVRSQRNYARREQEKTRGGDLLFGEMLASKDRRAIPAMLKRHAAVSVSEQTLRFVKDFTDLTDGLFNEQLKQLRRASNDLLKNKKEQKNLRRREQICLRRCEPATAVQMSTTFHLIHNALRQILYGLLRMSEPAREHLDNNFHPVSADYAAQYRELRNRLIEVMEDAADNLRQVRPEANAPLRDVLKQLRTDISVFRHRLLIDVQHPEANLNSMSLLLHLVQETEQIVTEFRFLLKNSARLDTIG